MQQYIDDFLNYLNVEAGLSQNTLDAYRGDLDKYRAFLEATGTPVTRVSPVDITEFISAQNSSGYASASISRYIAAVKLFMRFLYAEGIVSRDIAGALQSPKPWKKLPHVLSVEEVETIVEKGPSGKYASRNRAILELLYSCGARVSEVCAVRADSIDRQSGFIRLLGKGSKERIIPIGEQALGVVDAYLCELRSTLAARSGDTSPQLFLSRSGKPLLREDIWRIVKKCARSAGITKKIHPHVFRHTYATHLLENGADIRIVQELLGHANVSTTEIYTHLDKNRILNVHRKFHPRG